MMTLDYYLAMDEKLNSLLIAAKDENWDELESASSWVSATKAELESNSISVTRTVFHPDEPKLIQSITDKISLLGNLLIARLSELSVLTGNNATELKLVKAYG